MKACYMLALITAAGLAAADLSAQSPARQPKAPLFSGDWVGQITVGDSTLFVRARFTDASPSASGSIDVPQRSEWNLALRGVRLEPPSLTFAFVLGADTVRFEGLSGHAGIRGSLLIGKKTGTLELIRRAPYDSVAVRRLAGNYRIAPDRMISMGPMDEVGGWLAFFDSKTRRGGILYALSDSVFFTGPTFGIDYPIAIQAEFRLDAGGHARGLTWRERGTQARPMPYWRKVQVPVYIMLGGLDRSVPSAESATRLREAFAAVGNGDATVRPLVGPFLGFPGFCGMVCEYRLAQHPLWMLG